MIDPAIKYIFQMQVVKSAVSMTSLIWMEIFKYYVVGSTSEMIIMPSVHTVRWFISFDKVSCTSNNTPCFFSAHHGLGTCNSYTGYIQFTLVLLWLSQTDKLLPILMSLCNYLGAH